MADLALDAVFVPSSNAEFRFDALDAVCGPVGDEMLSITAILERYGTMGFQASSFARAVRLCKEMLQPQLPSLQQPSMEGAEITSEPLVQPTIFLGATANLFGTGCREAIRFLCAERSPLLDGVLPAVLPDEMEQSVTEENSISRFFFSRALVHVLVVSGGAMEHDIRRACESYLVSGYVSERNGERQDEDSAATEPGVALRFGNVTYGTGKCGLTPCLFTAVMRRLVARLVALQQRYKAAHAEKQSSIEYGDICPWAFSPSTVWYLAGRWLIELFAEALTEVNGEETREVLVDAQRRAESTVLYWAAKNDVPIFSPSFVDGDIMHFLFEGGQVTTTPHLKIDLVMDIHRINRCAMRSKRTGMIILGGGVVKHHVCNANLMRNGADYTVFINNGQEFDGSDAGARPDEAVSWGKIRSDGDYVKIYAEVSLVFPLLVAQVFLPWVRRARGMLHFEKN